MAGNRGVAYVGTGKVELKNIDYPKMEHNGRKLEHAVILKLVATNICGSDQHMVRGRTTAPIGMILGHEITGEIVEKGSDVEFLELRPGGDCVCTRRPVARSEELGDEVDVAAVRDLLEALHPVEGDVPPDEVAVGWVPAARDLFFPPAVQAIPDSGLLTDVRRHPTGLFDDEVLRFTVARVVLDSEPQTEAAFQVLYSGLSQ